MARLRVREIAEKRGIKNAHQLQLELGISAAKAARLWKGETTKIEIETIEQVCFGLKCSPADLFQPTTKKNWPKAVYR